MKADLFCDGGARGNPGPAGGAAVLYNLAGKVLGTKKKYLGEVTNNVAEYQGLLLGLKLAQELGVSQLWVKLDSELVVRQLRGEYRVKHPGLRPLWEACRKLLTGFASCDFTHIPREQNQAADELVNQVIDLHLRR